MEIGDLLRGYVAYPLTQGESVYWVSIGKAPNRDWRLICGPWEVGVEVKFDGARVVTQSVPIRSLRPRLSDSALSVPDRERVTSVE